MPGIFYFAWVLFSLAAILKLLLYKREPSSTISWLFWVTFVPVVGPIIFFLLGPQRLERKATKRTRQLHAPYPYSELPSAPVNLPKEATDIAQLIRQVSDYGMTGNNTIETFPDPVKALAAMHEAIDNAVNFVHLEYYIFAADEVTDQLFKRLVAAAQRGVEVRLLYDSLGSLSLKKLQLRPLIEAGVKTAGFLPFSVLPQRLHLNFRNHRKILVVDGKVGFTGGTNIGREYLGRRGDHQWRDNTVQVKGPVCLQLEDVFAKDWEFTTDENLFAPRYYPQSEGTGESLIQVLESGPDTAFRTLQQTIFLALTSAKKRILLTTAYFVPDASLIMALNVAALRGVDVRLLLPSKTDLLIVQMASRSFFDTLLKAGVRIYEYQPRVLHAKMLIVDDVWTMVGSANMDIRSFRLNFELNLMVYGPQFAQHSADFFYHDLQQSTEITLAEFEKRPLTQRIQENASRLFSPLL